jgi:hypothetical protein
MNDLLTPFYTVFMQENRLDNTPDTISKEELTNIESDCYYCLEKLLDGIQDNYVDKQPGIHRQIKELHDLLCRIDGNI